MNPALALFLQKKAIQAPMWAAGTGLLSYARSGHMPDIRDIATGKISAAFKAEGFIEEELGIDIQVPEILSGINPFDQLKDKREEKKAQSAATSSSLLDAVKLMYGQTEDSTAYADSLALAVARNNANSYRPKRASKVKLPKTKKPRKVPGL